jgi:hypothetical protein
MAAPTTRLYGRPTCRLDRQGGPHGDFVATDIANLGAGRARARRVFDAVGPRRAQLRRVQGPSPPRPRDRHARPQRRRVSRHRAGDARHLQCLSRPGRRRGPVRPWRSGVDLARQGRRACAVSDGAVPAVRAELRWAEFRYSVIVAANLGATSTGTAGPTTPGSPTPAPGYSSPTATAPSPRRSRAMSASHRR